MIGQIETAYMIYTASWKSVTESVTENTTYAASWKSVTFYVYPST